MSGDWSSTLAVPCPGLWLARGPAAGGGGGVRDKQSFQGFFT